MVGNISLSSALTSSLSKTVCLIPAEGEIHLSFPPGEMQLHDTSGTVALLIRGNYYWDRDIEVPLRQVLMGSRERYVSYEFRNTVSVEAGQNNFCTASL